MPGSGSRDARRTDQYLDGLIEAGARGADSTPMDMDLDPAVAFAAGELRAGLVRVHPSFRFEEGLASRLAAAAAEMGGSPAALAVAPSAVPASPAAPTFSRPGRPPRPLVVGGVGVASAALSLGAVYVAWRWSRASRPPMARAAHAARSGRGHTSGSGRRAGVLHGILG
jgi:hypothetical protein